VLTLCDSWQLMQLAMLVTLVFWAMAATCGT
jgi:hypothetical protein